MTETKKQLTGEAIVSTNHEQAFLAYSEAIALDHRK